MCDPDPTYPVLPAYEVRDPDGSDPQWVVWCPWCEAIHRHGPYDGHCVSHCHEPSSAYARRGYALAKAGDVADETEVRPKRFRPIGSKPLFSRIKGQARDFRAAVRRAVLPVSKYVSRQDCFIQRLDHNARVVVLDDEWWIERDGQHPHQRGPGLLQLAAVLFGVPAGIVAVRFLETLSGVAFDEKAVTAIAGAVDAWVSRGGPARWSQS